MGNKAPNPPGRPMAGEPESLEQLIGDCRRMAARWTHSVSSPASPPCPAQEPVVPAALHGITVPPASAHLVDGMADYGG